MPRGSVVVNFGAFPGASDASLVITGQPFIALSSNVEAWVRIADSADHSADEHWVETIRVAAGAIVAGVGFTIYAWNTNQVIEPLYRNARVDHANAQPRAAEIEPSVGGMGTRLYGQFNVDWVYVV